MWVNPSLVWASVGKSEVAVVAAIPVARTVMARPCIVKKLHTVAKPARSAVTQRVILVPAPFPPQLVQLAAAIFQKRPAVRVVERRRWRLIG